MLEWQVGDGNGESRAKPGIGGAFDQPGNSHGWRGCGGNGEFDRCGASRWLVSSLSSSRPNLASIPANVLVPAGKTTATFDVKTNFVRRNAVVNIRAMAGGVEKIFALTILRY